ncbi:hypothetical protein Bca52824_037393 [Brassica carinata]|uniref:non-specific serine/threonine protein kinase n=1 Tax=Brassica carinata TaxID=52824 RepID=A0A8X7V5Y8_BRACI|nr:hypothetical protein Bca52824_037393 [Brassica carinata]
MVILLINRRCHFVLLLLAALSCFSLRLCFGQDTITFSTPIKDSETLLCNNGIFRFGFFTPVNSTAHLRYVGIWYAKVPVQTVVWVANKDTPIKDTSGVISISGKGNLVVTDGLNRLIWSTNVSLPVAPNATWVQLMDNGNLRLQENRNKGEILWESFKHPYNSFLATMTIGTSNITGGNLKLTSWKSYTDPSTGNYTAGISLFPFRELMIWKSNVTIWRSGPWNGQIFVGLEDEVALLFLDGYNIISDKEGTFTVSYATDSPMYHMNLDPDGVLYIRSWSTTTRAWEIGNTIPTTTCDVYGRCGPFASCSSKEVPPCNCIEGFVPRNKTERNGGSWSSECVRSVPLQCNASTGGGGGGKGDVFSKMQKMKVPANAEQSLATEKDCLKVCLDNCSCTAYAYDQGIGCMLWSGDLVDMQSSLRSGIDLYIRLAPDLSHVQTHSNRAIMITASVLGFAFVAVAWKLWNDGDVASLADPTVLDESFVKEITKCVHIGLLCVQEIANDRPSVSTVIGMLTTEITNLPKPKQPAFIARGGVSEAECSDQSSQKVSINYVSLTTVTGLLMLALLNTRCHFLLLLLAALSCFSLKFCLGEDRITFLTPIKDSETLLSKSGVFRFGFFTPVNSTGHLRYVGIWYDKVPVQTVVWVANKDTPITDTSGVVSISEDGNLVVTDGLNSLLWSTNLTVPVSPNANWVQLMDSGNLRLQDKRNKSEILWESFEHPYNSFLPRMTLGTNNRTGENLKLTSWKSYTDPSPGNYTAGISLFPFTELMIWKNNVPVWRSGPWNGEKQIFTGLPILVYHLHGFIKMQKMKVPANAEQSPANEKDCPKQCLDNCSCNAYAYDRGIGCLLWSGDLVDMQSYLWSGIDLYIRLAHSELSELEFCLLLVLDDSFRMFASLIFALAAPEQDRSAELLFKRMEALTSDNESASNQVKLKELPLFEFKVLAAATDNFSLINKLGRGGFGPVYKGKLPEGQEIAVKRLSRASGQGLEELINEVVVISKLQHRNLVKLLGCCIEGEERLLVYEYMPKKSLDAYLFGKLISYLLSDPLKQNILDWKTRFNIIEGICRGLLYLHRDSRLKIIHRDLKASNILLDENLNPKISDFGLARVFQTNEAEANTRRVVGTYGYMSPEYAMEGSFSEKSDIFSLGVIFLEIISGRRNSHKEENSMNLLPYAWKLWNDGEVTSLADPTVLDESFVKEITKCVQIGLLCVQEVANDRPSVSTVIWMLTTENTNLPKPKQPAFIARRGVSEADCSKHNQKVSINDVSLTTITGR